MKTKILIPVATFMLSFMAFAIHAQITYDDNLDHVYQSIVTIYPSDPSFQGEGYAISSTSVDVGSGTTRGEVLRTDAAGNPMWAFYYDTFSGSNHRFTHIEKITQVTGDVQFLLIGSVDYGGNGTMTVTLIDDNGNVVNSEEFSPSTRSYLTGIKGIFDNSYEFVIVGVESDGFATTDEKDIIILSIDDSFIPIWEYELTTPHSIYDYDMVTDVFTSALGEFTIVGTSNENSSSQSEPAAMVATLNNTGVVWDYNFSTTAPSTGHSDNAASAVYDATSNSIWVLGNSSAMHYFNLTELDASSGTFLNAHTFGGRDDDNKYGFKLRESLANTDHLIISGYGYTYSSSTGSGYDATPFLVEFDKPSASINWKFSYSTNDPGIISFVENDMLYMTAIGQFGYFYNTIMDYKYDSNGYVFLSTDDQISSTYGFKLSGVDNSGYLPDPNCGMQKFSIDNASGSRYQTASLTNLTSPVSLNGTFVSDNPHSYTDVSCGSVLKKEANGTALTSSKEVSSKIYPNPATSVLYIEGYALATSINIHDLSGKLVYNEKLNNVEEGSSISINHLNAGMYMVQIMSNENLLDSKKLQVVE